MSTLRVERLGHVNLFVDDFEATTAEWSRLMGARPFREWERPEFGGHNALWLLTGTCIELFASTSPDGMIGRWLARNGPGWHSLEWTVPSLADAVAEIRRRGGIRIVEYVENSYCVTHPKDGHGISLQLTDRRFPGDSRDDPGWTPPPAGADNPLGIVGPAVIQVSAHDPDAGAQWAAELTGVATTRGMNQPATNIRSVAVDFADHSLEFVTPLASRRGDPLADFLRDRGQRIFAVAFPVANVDRARQWLADEGVITDVYGSDALIVSLEGPDGARVELRPVATHSPAAPGSGGDGRHVPNPDDGASR